MRLFWDWFNGDASTSGGFTLRHTIRNPVIFRSVVTTVRIPYTRYHQSQCHVYVYTTPKPIHSSMIASKYSVIFEIINKPMRYNKNIFLFMQTHSIGTNKQSRGHFLGKHIRPELSHLAIKRNTDQSTPGDHSLPWSYCRFS